MKLPVKEPHVTKNEVQELTEFLTGSFDRIDAWFDRLDVISGVRGVGLMVLAAATWAAGCSDSTGPSPDAISVNGRVVDEYMRPQKGVGVLIPGHDVVLADEDGRFSVSGVEKPYDLATSLLAERGALIYVGLFRDDPLVVVPAQPLLPIPHGGHLAGRVWPDGGDWPQNHRTSVLFESPQTVWWGPVDGAGGFALSPRWSGSEPTTGAIHALQWQFDPEVGRPTQYAYGIRSGIELASGASVGNQDVTLAPVESGRVSGSVSVPDGYALTSTSLSTRFGLSSPFAPDWEIVADGAGEESFGFATPVLPDAAFAVTASAAAGEATSETIKTGLGATAEGITLNIPAAPDLAPPEGAATNVPRNTFVWSGMSDALHLLAMRYVGTGTFYPPPPSIYVFTTESAATIPNLIPFGLFLHPGSQYEWQVLAWAPVQSTDEIMTERWFIPAGDRSSAVSAPGYFTVQR